MKNDHNKDLRPAPDNIKITISGNKNIELSSGGFLPEKAGYETTDGLREETQCMDADVSPANPDRLSSFRTLKRFVGGRSFLLCFITPLTILRSST